MIAEVQVVAHRGLDSRQLLMQERIADDPGRNEKKKREDCEEGMPTIEVKQKAEGREGEGKDDGTGEGRESEEEARRH